MGSLDTITIPWSGVGGARRCLIWKPTGWNKRRSWPALFALHGGAAAAESIRNQSRLDTVADANGFVVIYPDGYARLFGSPLRTWGAGSCCGNAITDGSDDVAYMRALVKRLTPGYELDPARLYATGFSNGAMLAHRLGAQASDLFAAIAPVSGDLWNLGLPAPANPTPTIYFQGELDTHIPIEGGVGPDAIDGVAHQPAVDVVDWWIAANHATTPAVTTTGTGYTVKTYGGAAPVIFYDLANGAHQWPGGVAVSGLGPIQANVDASNLIWNFVKQFRRVKTLPTSPIVRGSAIEPGTRI